MFVHERQIRLPLCLMVGFVVFGFLLSGSLEARERQQLSDPHPSNTLSGVLIATPLFEKGSEVPWVAYKRPVEDPMVQLFGGQKDLLLYGRNGFPGQPDPAELANLKSLAGAYLTTSPILKEALKARQKARWIIVKELTHGKARRKEAASIAAAATLRSWEDEPLVLLARTPLIGRESQGPHAVPQPITVYNASDACIAFDSFYIVLSDSRQDKASEVPFNVERSVGNNTLDLVVCHELAHGIMFDAYGRPDNTGVGAGPSIHGHSTEYITDRQKAYAEGWAEAFEAFFGRNKRNLNSLGESQYGVASFLLERQDPVSRDRWLWLNGTSTRTANLKNPAQMMACEGVIAGVFFDILSNRALVSPFEKSIEIMVRKKPADFPEFLNDWLECFPGDRRVLLRIFLEYVRYATVETSITEHYKASYRARRALKTRSGSSEALREAEKAYASAKENAFSRLLSSGNPFSGLPEPLWFGLEYVERKGEKVNSFVRINLDLNTADALLLDYSGLFKGKELDIFLAQREKEGGFRGKPLEVLRRLVGEERWKKLPEEGFKLFPHPLSN